MQYLQLDGQSKQIKDHYSQPCQPTCINILSFDFHWRSFLPRQNSGKRFKRIQKIFKVKNLEHQLMFWRASNRGLVRLSPNQRQNNRLWWAQKCPLVGPTPAVQEKWVEFERECRHALGPSLARPATIYNISWWQGVYGARCSPGILTAAGTSKWDSEGKVTETGSTSFFVWVRGGKCPLAKKKEEAWRQETSETIRCKSQTKIHSHSRRVMDAGLQLFT